MASASTSTPIMSLSFMMRYSTPSILTSVPDHLPNRMRSPTLTSIGELAALVAAAGSNGDDLALLRLLLGGVGNDDATSGLRLGIGSLDDNAVVKRSEFHWCPPTVLSKSWRIWKADRYFESCSFAGADVRDPCDQVALLNALKELEWLTPFDEGSHATSSARTWEGAGAYGTRIRMQTLFGVLLPADGTRTATVGNGDFGTSPFFVGQLSDKPLLASICLCGVSGAKNNGGSKNYVLI